VACHRTEVSHAARTGRTVRATLAALSLAVVVSGAGCTASEPSESAETEQPAASGTAASGMAGDARLVPDCPPAPEQRARPNAGQLNRLVTSIDLPAWQAADIGASARLSDGRLVWLFGDTVRTPQLSPRIVANSMLVTSGRCVAQLRRADDGPVIPDVDGTTVRWPMSVAVGRRGSHDVIVVLTSRIRRGSGGSFDFTFLGTSAAVFTVEHGQAPQLEKVLDLTSDSTDPQQINWGSAANVHDGWYYVYGTRLTGEQYVFGRELYVARAPVADPGQRSRWRFWDGNRWTSDHGSAAVILPADTGVSQTLSVDTVGGEFVAISKRDGDIGDFVYKWTAPNPWGPWTGIQELEAPGGFDTGKLKYAPLAHPEIPLADGRLLVSVSRNTTDVTKLFQDPEIGRPYFVEVPRG
jgi:hypothetical protein